MGSLLSFYKFIVIDNNFASNNMKNRINYQRLLKSKHTHLHTHPHTPHTHNECYASGNYVDISSFQHCEGLHDEGSRTNQYHFHICTKSGVNN